MKRFLAKVLLLFFLVFASVALINFIYVNRTKNSNIDNIKKFNIMPDQIQICNLGSSHGEYGYNYCDWDKKYKCFNFGLSSQSLSYDYRLLKYYGDHINKGTIVFITVSYFILFGKDETECAYFDSMNRRYYSILPDKLIKKYDFSTDVMINYFPSLSVLPTVMIKSIISGPPFLDDRWKNNTDSIDLAKDANSAFERHLLVDKLDSNGNRIENKKEINALNDIIVFCQKKGAIPILITPPFLAEYTDLVKTDKTFYSDFYSIVHEISNRTGTDYYDFALDKRFANQHAWFMNADHLNEEGARNFVNILMKDIVLKRGYIH